jgi:exportin-5
MLLTQYLAQNFSKKSPELLRVDAQVMLVDASVKGYTKWLSTQEENDPQQNEQDRNTMLGTFVTYFEISLPMQFKDPAVERKVLSSLTIMAIRIFHKSRPDLGTQLLDHFLNLRLHDSPAHHEYSEAAKALVFLGVTESQKLASIWADTWITMYENLEQRIQQNLARDKPDPAHSLGWQNFLFTIVLHSQTLDSNAKYTKLRQFVDESNTSWLNPEFDTACKDFTSFFSRLGLDQLAEYLYTHNFHKLDNWTEHMLDEQGRTLQDNFQYSIDNIPHRATRMLLMATFDKLRENDPNTELVQKLWGDAMPAFLQNLMQSIRHAHQFGDRSSWPRLPDEMQHIIGKMLTDRFWQAGISNESMDDFYARVNASKHSYEGFASTIRGGIRQIREKSYSILCYLARLESHFYALPELPNVLAQNVYQTAHSLSAHQWTILLNMSEQLIRGCPLDLRSAFLPPVLTSLLQNLEAKLVAEWDAVTRRTTERSDGEDLGDEMKRESILRMLTGHAVQMVGGLLDIGETHPLPSTPPRTESTLTRLQTSQPPNPTPPNPTKCTKPCSLPPNSSARSSCSSPPASACATHAPTTSPSSPSTACSPSSGAPAKHATTSSTPSSKPLSRPSTRTTSPTARPSSRV